MKKSDKELKILYSYGVNDHNEEILLNIETFDEEIINYDKYNYFIIVGDIISLNRFDKPLPSIDELSDFFMLYQIYNDNNKANSFHALIYKYAAIKCGTNRFMFNKYIQTERLTRDEEFNIYEKYRNDYKLKLKK